MGGGGERPIADLEARLAAAVACEDFGLAATLRDELKEVQLDGAAAAEAANRAFYDAFQRSSLKEMDAIWGAGDHVQCVHPMAGCICGREDVMESWRLVLGNDAFDSIRLEDVRVHATGSLAFVTCLEVVRAGGTTGRILATNVFERQDGTWKIVLHHGSIPPPDMAL